MGVPVNYRIGFDAAGVAKLTIHSIVAVVDVLLLSVAYAAIFFFLKCE